MVIPCFNGHTLLRKTLESVLVDYPLVVVVDDGSVPPLREGIRDLPVHLLRHSHNLGQGAALETGTRYALSLKAEVLVHVDADGQHRVEDLPALIAPVLSGQVDICLGSRFLQPQSRQAVPRFRRLMLLAARWFNGCLSGIWLSDAHNGLRALSRDAARHLKFRQPGMAHATEILYLIRRHRWRYCESPTHIRYEPHRPPAQGPLGRAAQVLYDLLLKPWL